MQQSTSVCSSKPQTVETWQEWRSIKLPDELHRSSKAAIIILAEGPACLRLLSRLAIGEDEFSTASRQRESPQPAQFFRFFLIGPQENFLPAVP